MKQKMESEKGLGTDSYDIAGAGTDGPDRAGLKLGPEPWAGLGKCREGEQGQCG